MGDLQLLAGALFLGVPEKPCTNQGQSRRGIWVLKAPHSLGGTHHPKGRGSLDVSGFPPPLGRVTEWDPASLQGEDGRRERRPAGALPLPDPRLPKPTAGREQPRAVARQPAPSPALAGVAHSDARRAWCTAGPRGVRLLAAGCGLATEVGDASSRPRLEYDVASRAAASWAGRLPGPWMGHRLEVRRGVSSFRALWPRDLARPRP